MKAIIELVVEVDLSQIICDDSLDALKMFTGETTKEGVGTFYMDKLARTITSPKEFTMPHVKYSLTGNIVPTENLEDAHVDLSDYSLTDLVTDVENDGQAEEVVDLDDVQENSSNRVEVIDKIASFVEKVSMDKGLPLDISITAELFDSVCILDNGEVMSRIVGIPVVRKDDLETLVAVAYKPYFGSETKDVAYMQTLGNII